MSCQAAASELAFVGPPYFWHDQYLCYICTKMDNRKLSQAAIERLLCPRDVQLRPKGASDKVSKVVKLQNLVLYHAADQEIVDLLALSRAQARM